MPGSVQGQVGWGPEQPGWKEMVLQVHSNPGYSVVLGFYDSMYRAQLDFSR